MSRRDQIIQNVNECLTNLDHIEIFDLVSEAIHDLEKQHPRIFEKGPIDIWAASLTYAIARHNFMHFQDLHFPLNLGLIGKFYNLKSKTISAKAGKLSDKLKLNLNNQKYRFQEDKFESENESLDCLDQLTIFDQYEFRLLFSIGKKYKRHEKYQLIEFIKLLAKNINKDREPEDHFVITNIRIGDSTMNVEFEGFTKDLLELYKELLEKDIKLLDIEADNLQPNRYTPDPEYCLLMEQYELLDLESFSYQSQEEVDEELRKFAGKTVDDIRKTRIVSPKSEAIISALKSFLLPKKESIEMAKDIISEFPDCVEAYICLAGWEDDEEARIDLLEDALEAGERSLDVEQINEDKLWWKYHKTRPYMRAMLLLAEELLLSGYEDEAIDFMQELLEMNYGDNQGARLLLMDYFVFNRKWSKAAALFGKYPNDSSLNFIYGYVIYLFYTLGKKSKTKRALYEAYKRNPHPLRIMLRLEDIPEDVSYYRHGDPTEALEVLNLLTGLCNRDIKLTRWIIETLQEKDMLSEQPDDPGTDFPPEEDIIGDQDGARIVPFQNPHHFNIGRSDS